MIAERYNPVADDLAGFMTFAGDQENVTGAQIGDGAPDRLPPVAGFTGAARGSDDCGANCAGIFAAGIVVGDDHPVGFGGGDGAHQGPFAAIAIAAGAEYHDEPAADVGPLSVERFGERIGLVCIIDKNLRAMACADAL